MKRVAMIGVPIETVGYYYSNFSCSEDHDMEPSKAFCDIYVPGITEKTRDSIKILLNEIPIQLVDLGEIVFAEHKKMKGDINRESILSKSELLEKNNPMNINEHELETERIKLRGLYDEYDLIFAIGPSHLGAITLYDETDCVLRMDYHDDFSNLYYEGRWNGSINFDSYMDWIKFKVKPKEVFNRYVKYGCRKIFGSDYKKGDHLTANHFDIDVDCMQEDYEMSTPYNFNHGSPEATMDELLAMAREAKPHKIGLWEYRPQYDKKGLGIPFIADLIKAAIGKN